MNVASFYVNTATVFKGWTIYFDAGNLREYYQGELVTPYTRMFVDVFWPEQGGAETLNVAGKVFTIPVNVTFHSIVNKIGFYVAVQAGNLRVGIYRDNGDTPAGGALVVESGSVACGAAGPQEIAIAATRLIPGLYWVVIQSDTTTAQVFRGSGWLYAGSTLNGKTWANAGGYGAFENPQVSAVTANQTTLSAYLMASQIIP